jgi:hypothetical protein
MNLVKKPLPQKMIPWMREEIERTRGRIETDTQVVAGVLRWKMGNIVPPHVIEQDALMECPPVQRAAYEKELGKFAQQYRAAREKTDAEFDGEDAYERRAAFGPGVTVINVLTGKTYRS